MVFLLCLPLLGSLFAGPATRPAAPEIQPQLKQWFDQLADRDPDVREAAKTRLMGLSRGQLLELKSLIEQSRPLKPSQVAELHDIVTHAYLSGEQEHPGAGSTGFLGLSWPRGAERMSEDPPGLVIVSRIKGFVAYRYLREGDILVGIAELPHARFTAVQDLSTTLMQVRGGTSVTLIVVRAGSTIRIPVVLDARPQWPGGVDQLQALREKSAEDFWEQNFAPLVSETMTSAGSS